MMEAKHSPAMEDGKPIPTDVRAAMQVVDRRRSPPVLVNFNFHAPVIIVPEISIEALIAYLQNYPGKTP
jgi:hypothetical protein